MDISQWNKAIDRLDPNVCPEISPSFKIQPNSKIFTIGSCFARNIEEHLDRLDFSIPMLGFAVPKSEWAFRGNGILNKYTPVSILQTLEWVYQLKQNGGFDPASCQKFIFNCEDQTVIDLDVDGYVPVTEARFYQRRMEIFKLFEQAFDSDCVVITLGLIEAWFDSQNRIYIQKPPITRQMTGKDRFSFKVLTFGECYTAVQETINLFRKINNSIKFIITTSPVPLDKTFTSDDIITANMFSKALLRTVCGEIAKCNSNIDYFPSFEMVMLTKSWDVWAPDKRHIRDSYVGEIVSRLADAYFPDISDTALNYQRAYSAFKDQKYNLAQELIDKSMEQRPQSERSFALYARILLSMGRYADALEKIENAIALSPNHTEYQILLGKILFESNDFPNAVVVMRSVLQKESHIDALMILGKISFINRDFDDASRFFKQAIQANPEFSDGYFWLSKTLTKLNRIAEATLMGEMAFALNKKDERYLELSKFLKEFP